MPFEMTPEVAADPEAARGDAWQHLARGVVDRRSPFHAPTLVTVDADNVPHATTVVLQLVDADERRLACHTRADAAKVDRIGGGAVVAWHAYDRRSKLQVVARGPARVEREGELADARWADTSHGSAACYRRVHPPGRPFDESTSSAERGDGRDRFAVVVGRVDELDWLFLHHAGHVRWRFTWSGDRWLSQRLTT